MATTIAERGVGARFHSTKLGRKRVATLLAQLSDAIPEREACEYETRFRDYVEAADVSLHHWLQKKRPINLSGSAVRSSSNDRP